jgi:YVTN family beta-propeller protein
MTERVESGPAPLGGAGSPEGARPHDILQCGSVILLALLAALALPIAGCKQNGFSPYPANYREYAYVSNSGSNTVTVLDLVNMRQDRVIPVGNNPSGLAINPQRREVYVVNSGSDTLSVINARTNTVAATIHLRHQPYFIDVDALGQRAYVANSKSNDVSVLDLRLRQEIGVIGVGQAPGFARISPDENALVVTNRVSGSISIADPHTLKVRSTFDHCPGATDAIILPDSSKTLVACSGGHQVMVVALARRGDANTPASADHLLTFLDVGQTPVQLALKPDGGEAFVSNFDSATISEIDTSSNEVGGAYLVGSHPVRGLVSADNSLLYVSDFSTGRVSVYAIDDGKLISSVKVGEGPDVLAFSANGQLLFVVDTQSGDIATVRTQTTPPSLLTLFPAGRKPTAIAVISFRFP